jgi:hypothetical protein
MRGVRRPLTRLEWQFAAGMAILIWCACAPPRTRPMPLSGAWSGTTSQGRAIRFTVTPYMRVTSVTVEYAFDGCSGTFDIPGEFPVVDISGRPGAVIRQVPSGNRIVVNFLFPSIRNATGAIQFMDVPTCANTYATWTATHR